jgi:hypothetical protein
VRRQPPGRNKSQLPYHCRAAVPFRVWKGCVRGRGGAGGADRVAPAAAVDRGVGANFDRVAQHHAQRLRLAPRLPRAPRRAAPAAAPALVRRSSLWLFGGEETEAVLYKGVVGWLSGGAAALRRGWGGG